jgi:hypothetical protein
LLLLLRLLLCWRLLHCWQQPSRIAVGVIG